MEPETAKQGNFEDGYQENIYDETNLGDNAWTDTAANPNPQLTGYGKPEKQQNSEQWELELDWYAGTARITTFQAKAGQTSTLAGAICPAISTVNAAFRRPILDFELGSCLIFQRTVKNLTILDFGFWILDWEFPSLSRFCKFICHLIFSKETNTETLSPSFSPPGRG